MKIKKIVICILCLLLAGAGIFRYITLNQKYPPPEIINYSESEPVIYDGQFEITVADNYFLDEQTVKTVFENEISLGQDVKCYLLELTIKNIGDTEKQILIYSFMLESDAWYNGVNMGAFMQLNSDTTDATLQPTLAPGEEYQAKLPFSMISEQFKPASWEEVQNRQYSLVMTLYPQKTSIQLS